MNVKEDRELEAAEDGIRRWEEILSARIAAAAAEETLYATARERRGLLGHTPEAIDAITGAYAARIRAERDGVGPG